MLGDLEAAAGYHAGDFLTRHPPEHGLSDEPGLNHLRHERWQNLTGERFSSWRCPLEALPAFAVENAVVDGPEVQIGHESEAQASWGAALDEALRAFIPWKKGPFRFFGRSIDAEWRSDWKWERLLPHLPSLKGARIADIGCHNGYFMFRMAAHDPEMVVGFEPVGKHWFHFHLSQRFLQRPNLFFELLGAEHIDFFPRYFDVIFSLGILYHHTDPVTLLRKAHAALKPGGWLVVDCQGIPGAEPVALTPRRRYAGARGIWFLPTASCLRHWMVRAGFRDVTCIYGEPLSCEEQRSTAWAPIDSLREFLDPEDPSRTKEGHPAPYRYYVKARR